jgi:hypothetical protein
MYFPLNRISRQAKEPISPLSSCVEGRGFNCALHGGEEVQRNLTRPGIHDGCAGFFCEHNVASAFTADEFVLNNENPNHNSPPP